MTKNHLRQRGARAGRPVRLCSALAALAAATLLVSCSSNAPPASSTSSATTNESTTITVPTTEAIPSLGTDSTTGNGGDGGDSGGIVEVKAPTLGSHFSGTAGWGPNDVALGDLRITISSDDTAHYNFGVFAESGEAGLTYGETSLAPAGGYFQLNAGCSGKPIATSPNDIQDGNSDDQCNQLTFDPSLDTSASDPFDAVLTLHFQLTCTGQDNPTCRQDSSAKSAGPGNPVVLDFARSINLHGAVSGVQSGVDESQATSTTDSSPLVQSIGPPSEQSAAPTG